MAISSLLSEYDAPDRHVPAGKSLAGSRWLQGGRWRRWDMSDRTSFSMISGFRGSCGPKKPKLKRSPRCSCRSERSSLWRENGKGGGLRRGGLRLRAVERHQVAPEIALAVDRDEAGMGHGAGSPGRGRLSGPLLGRRAPGLDRGLRLQPMQVIDGALRMGGGAEDQALVVAQRLEPRADISGVILANLRRQLEIRREKGGAKLGHQFLPRIAFIAMAHPPEIARQAPLVLGPVRHLVREGRRVVLGVSKRLKGRHLHVVGAFGGIGAGATVADDGAGGGKEPVGALDGGGGHEGRGRGITGG